MTIHIGRIGLWAPVALWDREGGALPGTAAELEGLGFETLWLGNGPAMMDTASAILNETVRITVATAIANIWVHPAATIAARYREIADRHPGRMLVGLGNGPRAAVHWQLSPYRKMIEYFDELDHAGIPADSRILAAVGPKMLALAAARSLGAHPFLTTLDHTTQARAALGPGPLLAPELKVVLSTDPVEARAIARQALGFYLDKRGYSGNLRRLGLGDDDFADGGSDRLIDATVAWGDAGAVLSRVDEHHLAGADHVALQVLTWDSDSPQHDRRRLPVSEFRALAAAWSRR